MTSSFALKATLFGACLLLPVSAYSHPGRTDAYGCHNETATRTYHCHSGRFAGQSFSSKDAMLRALANNPAPSSPTNPAPTNPTPTSPTTPPPAQTAYNRDLYRHWIDADGDCQDARQEVLIAESQIPVILSANGCSVVSGIWQDPYTGRTFTNPSDLDIDHMIPLKEAHDSGAWQWSAELKEQFANDLAQPYALIAVHNGANRSKSDRDPANWMPESTVYHCEYIKNWVAVKQDYALTMDDAERVAVNKILNLTNSSARRTVRSGYLMTATGDVELDAEFSVGLERVGVCGYVNAARSVDAINISGSITASPHHIGQIADLFVVAQVGSQLFQRLSDGSFVPWDFSITTLQPSARNARLSDSTAVNITTGVLGLAANIDIFLAYRTQAGEFVYTPTPVSVRIE